MQVRQKGRQEKSCAAPVRARLACDLMHMLQVELFNLFREDIRDLVSGQRLCSCNAICDSNDALLAPQRLR